MIEQIRIAIASVAPQVDGRRFAIKAAAGNTLDVAADVRKDGHEVLRAAVIWRRQ
jgi:starch synthase (maltosyl-transferring)